MPFQIVRNDIVRMHVDAIVNAANEHLRRGGGVCGAIFAAAGPSELQAACDQIGHCDTGSAVATPAFALPAKHVIHAVGPVWYGGGNGEEQALRSCYRTSLELARQLGDESIAFPLISSGIYGYPKEQAINVAIDEIRAFLDRYEMDVYLILFDTEALRATQGRFGRVIEYINDQYVRDAHHLRRESWEESAQRSSVFSAEDTAFFEPISAPPPAADARPTAAPAPDAAPRRTAAPMRESNAAAPMRESHAAASPAPKRKDGFLKRLLKNLDAPFSTTLMRMIDQRGMKDSEVYKRANMSRQHFSKIRSNPHYQPKKQTVLALAVALELSLDETRTLLERAGFALTHADERDVIVEYFISQGQYDIFEINLALYAFDQPLLG